MTDDTRYEVVVRPARWGHLADVDKVTTCGSWGDGEPWEMRWEPRPTYWRPTRAWALSRAQRKQRRLTAHEQRLAAWGTA